MAFIDSLGANAILFGVYIIYQLLQRCMHSKCRYNKAGGLDFDLGEPVDAVTDMDKIAELIKARSIHHKNNASASSSI